MEAFLGAAKYYVDEMWPRVTRDVCSGLSPGAVYGPYKIFHDLIKACSQGD